MANVEHEALAYGEQHVFHFAEYANSTAREAATGLTSGDDHKVALQTDDHSYWILTDYTGPTWVPMIGTPGDDTVTGAKIVDDAIDSEHYTDGSIDLAHMSANSVDSDQYVDGSIDLAHMSANSVDSDQYVDGSIDAAHLASDAVETAKIKALNVTTAKLAADCVDDTKIGDAKVKKEHINTDIRGAGLAGGAGTALSVDGIVEVGASAELKVKVISFSGWDMDTTVNKSVAHGLTLTDIRNAQVIIRNNANTDYRLLDYGTGDGGEFLINATNVVMGKRSPGVFDNANYNGAGARGFITIWYVA